MHYDHCFFLEDEETDRGRFYPAVIIDALEKILHTRFPYVESLAD